MRRKARRRPAVRDKEAESLYGWALDVYGAVWRALSPAERLRRSWRLRHRLKNIEAVHDEKSLPKL